MKSTTALDVATAFVQYVSCWFGTLGPRSRFAQTGTLRSTQQSCTKSFLCRVPLSSSVRLIQYTVMVKSSASIQVASSTSCSACCIRGNFPISWAGAVSGAVSQYLGPVGRVLLTHPLHVEYSNGGTAWHVPSIFFLSASTMPTRLRRPGLECLGPCVSGICLVIPYLLTGDPGCWALSGLDANDEFVKQIQMIENILIKDMKIAQEKNKDFKTMIITPEQLGQHKAIVDCWICKSQFKFKNFKVKHHIMIIRFITISQAKCHSSI